jgi:hypothetical protein
VEEVTIGGLPMTCSSVGCENAHAHVVQARMLDTERSIARTEV